MNHKLQDTETFLNSIKYCVLDCETTTHNKGNRFDPRNGLVSYSFKLSSEPSVSFKYYNDPDFSSNSFLSSASVVVGFNFKFDLHWLGWIQPDLDSRRLWDCQLAEYVYSGQEDALISLDECLERYNLEKKKSVVSEMWDAGIQTNDIPINILEEYGNWDVEQEEKLFLIQQTLLSDKQKNLVYIMGEDLKVLAHMEQAGIKFDKEGARKRSEEYQERIRVFESQLAACLPDIQHGTFNWDSGDHLSCFLYGGVLTFDYATSHEAIYKSGTKKGQPYIKNTWHEEIVSFPKWFVPLEGTEVAKTKNKDVPTRIYQTDSPTLKSLKAPTKEHKQLLEWLNARSQLLKVVEMIESLFEQFEKKGWQDDIIHAQYNQNIARTGRLTSTGPNMQNTPPEIDEFLVSRYD